MKITIVKNADGFKCNYCNKDMELTIDSKYDYPIDVCYKCASKLNKILTKILKDKINGN